MNYHYQERQIDPVNIDYPNTKEDYLEKLAEPVSLTQQEHSETADLYFSFLKSIIYCRASENLNSYPWIPPQLKELNMTICSILSSHRHVDLLFLPTLHHHCLTIDIDICPSYGKNFTEFGRISE